MAEEIMETTEQPIETAETNYIEAINNLKKNTVSKEMYEKVLADNKNLLDTLVNGGAASTEAQPQEEKADISELQKKLFTERLSDSEFVETALKLRERQLEETGFDIFSAFSPKQQPAEGALEGAQKVADVLSDCLDQSNGDDRVFHAYFENKINETIIPPRGNNKTYRR